MSNKPGRNDPCYCGSGKKYKKCHLPLDQAEEREHRNWNLAATFLREDIIDYAQDEDFAIPFATALPRFWNGLYDLENAGEMAPDESRIFFDWFAFDYLLEDGRRVLQHYREDVWDDLSSHQQQTLDNWLAAGPLSGYELTGYEGQTLHLREILTGETFQVFEPAGRGDMEEGDVLLARLVPVQDHLEFTTDVPYIPKEETAGLIEKLEAARAAFQEEHPDAAYHDFLYAHNHLLAHHALEEAEKVGRPPVARLDPDRPDKAARTLAQRFVPGRR